MAHKSINRVVLVGRLTRDPELRELSSGQSVCSLRIACSGLQRDGDGDYVERPNYFDVSAFGGQAQAIERFMRKGSRVAVDGRLEWREWETAEQERRQAVGIVADSVEFLDYPSDDDGDRGAGARPDGELAGVAAGEIGGELGF